MSIDSENASTPAAEDSAMKGQRKTKEAKSAKKAARSQEAHEQAQG